MIGQNALLSTLERMLVEETHGSTITVVCLALIFVRVLVGEGICVNMPMGCLKAGSTQLSTELGSVRMAQVVQDGSVFLPTQPRSFARCMSLQGLLFHLHDQMLQVPVQWTWLRL